MSMPVRRQSSGRSGPARRRSSSPRCARSASHWETSTDEYLPLGRRCSSSSAQSDMLENNCGSSALTCWNVFGDGESVYGFGSDSRTIGWFQYTSGQ
ncbi:MAG: hypothetical protein BWZ09_02746 [Alphaproteobacteria bacterium ADurb.BinA305]|nr:MAG: hypothetical protein BWZ09_02746 [Alphaproteobacteria bacterium ADurb.BinA305]